jgi:hypothetical protein
MEGGAMIEIVGIQDTEGRNLEGRYVLTGLPLGIGGKVSFPGAPLFVEKSTLAGHHCRKILLPGIQSGLATDAVLVPEHWDDHSIRVRNEYVRFICETPGEVVHLINSQQDILRAMRLRGYVPDSVIRDEVLGIIAVIDPQDEQALQPVLR